MTTNVTTLLTGSFYKSLLDAIFDAVYVVDVQGNIMYWNDSCSRITGYSFDEMIGQTFTNTPFGNPINDTTRQNTNHSKGITIVLETGMPGTWKGYVCRKNGQHIPIESHISPITNETGQVVGAIEVFRDISAQVALEDAHRQLLQMSRKDLLTSLNNRAAISQLLRAEIDRAHRYKQDLSVVIVDIDHFKRINDNYGHDAGDKVLATIGSILNSQLRSPDVVGRWGGEEFLIIAPNSDEKAAKKMADRVRKYIKKSPMGDLPETITASFGIAQLKEGISHDRLIYFADMALYKAKNTGRDRVIIATDDIKMPV